MANVVAQFIDPDDLYTGGYTSKIIPSTRFGSQAFQTRGVIQVEITTGTVELEMRLTPDAPWLSVATYDADTIEELVMANFMRVVVSASARAWLGVAK